MKILLLYYTGTYNTRFLTEKIKEMWFEKGYEISQVEITNKTPKLNAESYDLIGLGYPIYGFNSPRPFNKFLRTVKFKKGQRYFIYKNSGETMAMNKASNRVIKRIMNHKKVKLIGEYHFVMPYNIHFPYEEDFIKQIFHYDKKLLKIMDYDLEHGLIRKIKSNLIYDIASFFVSIQKIGGNINSFFYKVDEDKCIKCSKCINNCPHENIYLKGGKIHFHHHCDMCMRCSFCCPTNAIKIGFLEGWKVNGIYPLNKLWEFDGKPPLFITENSKGFYKCFYKSFREIDSIWNSIDSIEKNTF